MLYKPLKMDPVIVEVLPNVFVGNSEGASKRSRLDAHGITHIAVVAAELCEYLPFPEIYTYLTCNLRDEENADLTPHSLALNAFTQRALRSGGRVLIYCQVGISRSIALTAMYVYFTYSDCFSAMEALAFVKRVRKLPCSYGPNSGFLRQLSELEVERRTAEEEEERMEKTEEEEKALQAFLDLQLD